MSRTRSPVVHYVHLPGVRLAKSRPFEVLGGQLEPFDFKEFARLDADWASQTYFERTQPTIWKCTRETGEFDDPDAEFASVRDDSLLVYYAVLMQTEYFFPDPRMSVHYRESGSGGQRRVGPLGRTQLLAGSGTPALEPEELKYVAQRAALMERSGLRPQDQILGPLRVIFILSSWRVGLRADRRDAERAEHPASVAEDDPPLNVPVSAVLSAALMPWARPSGCGPLRPMGSGPIDPVAATAVVLLRLSGLGGRG